MRAEIVYSVVRFVGSFLVNTVYTSTRNPFPVAFGVCLAAGH